MTSIPAQLPALMSTALQAGATVEAWPSRRESRDWVGLRIVWADESETWHEWRLGPDAVWSHKGPGRLTDTRARIKRETTL